MVINRKFYVVILVLIGFGRVAKSQSVSVADFGSKPDTYENQTQFVQKAIDACRDQHARTLVFPKGRYDFWPEGAIRAEYFISNTSTEQECPSKVKTVGMLFKKMADLAIEGNGSLFVFHGKMTTMVFDQCSAMQLQNVHIDFERPTMSEMRYAAVSEKGVEVEIHPDARYSIMDGHLIWHGEGWRTTRFHAIEYDTTLKTMRYSDWKPFDRSKATELRPNRVRFETPKTVQPKPGNVLTVRDIIRDQVGLFIVESKNVTLQDVGMHYMHGLGIVSQFTENCTMRRVICAPRPETGRLIASSADFMHFSGCRGKITVEDCIFEGSHDDPINVHGTNLRMVERTGPNQVKLRFMHGQSYGFRAFFPGDSIAFVHAESLIRFATGQVKTTERLSDREVLIMLEKPLPDGIEPNDCMENMTWTPEVLIRGCRFTRTNTRGLLLTTPRKAVVENNVFFRTGMSAILIEGDAEGWFESGPVRDITIRNNEFVDCGYMGGPGNAVIAINPSNKIPDANKPVHTHIRIENNTFKVFDYPVLVAKSTRGLRFKGNTIQRTTTLLPQTTNKNMIFLNACSDVVLSGNILQGDVLGRNVKTENMKGETVVFD
jgi:hypothetical protein